VSDGATPPVDRVRADFDRIATLSEPLRNDGGHYDRFLLGIVPAGCRRALEVGCGTGAFTRLLSLRADRVEALDLSGEMIRIARERLADRPNVELRRADVLEEELPAARFDCIVTIATLHHLPHETAIVKLRDALAPGGVLIAHDLIGYSGLVDRGLDAVRLPVDFVLRWCRTGSPLPHRALRRAWTEHGRGERYLTLREVESMRDRLLPGARIDRHLLWRYTLVWRKAPGLS
jgi:SAM-dependent methyltransferase